MKPTTQSSAAGAQGSAARLGLVAGGERAERGAAMLAALCFASVLAIALGSYITVCYRTLEMSSRTVQGTQAVQLAETGMEDALWALNKADWSTWTITGTTATKTIPGFTFDNNVTGQITTSIANYDGVSGTRVITVNGSTTTTAANAAGTPTVVTRTLTSTSSKAPLFVNAIAGTTGRVKFKVAGTVDSYDSTLGDYSTQTPTFSAIVSSGSVSTTSATVQLTNAQIKGYVATVSTGPSYSTSAKIVGPTTPATTKIDSNQLSSSPYQPDFAEIAVTGSSTALPSGTATIGTAGATTKAKYYVTDLDLTNSDVLTINGPVVISVSGYFSITSSAKIRITSTGSLEMHVGGDLTINGNGIQNDTKLAKNCVLIGTSDLTTAIGMATNTVFYGAIYTPTAALTITNSQTIYGALVARSVTFSASPTFHYDLSLRQETFSGIEAPFAVANVRETTAGN